MRERGREAFTGRSPWFPFPSPSLSLTAVCSDVDGSSPFAAAFWMSLKGTKAPLLSGLPSMLFPSFLPECLASETTAVVSQIWCACKGYLTKASLGT